MIENGFDCCKCRMRNVIMGCIIQGRVYCWKCVHKMPKYDRMDYTHRSIKLNKLQKTKPIQEKTA